jgi:hypothetical protein
LVPIGAGGVDHSAELLVAGGESFDNLGRLGGGVAEMDDRRSKIEELRCGKVLLGRAATIGDKRPWRSGFFAFCFRLICRAACKSFGGQRLHLSSFRELDFLATLLARIVVCRPATPRDFHGIARSLGDKTRTPFVL